MIVKLLTEHHLEFLSLKGGCTCSSESTLVKMPLCWKSHALAHLVLADKEFELFTALVHLCSPIWNILQQSDRTQPHEP